MKTEIKAFVNFLQSREFGYRCLVIQEIQHCICQELLGMQGWRNKLWVVLMFSSPGHVPHFRVTRHLAIALVFWADQSVLISEDLPFPRYQKGPFGNQNHRSALSPRHYTQQGSVSTGALACWKPKDNICETKISRSSLKLENETYHLFFTTWTLSVYRDALLCPGIFRHIVCFTINCNFLTFIVFCYHFP